MSHGFGRCLVCAVLSLLVIQLVTPLDKSATMPSLCAASHVADAPPDEDERGFLSPLFRRFEEALGEAIREGMAEEGLRVLERSCDVRERAAAAADVAFCGSDRNTLSAIASLLHDPSEFPVVRIAAVQALGRRWEWGAEGAPILASLLEEEELVLEAVEALMAIGPPAHEALPELKDFLGRLETGAVVFHKPALWHRELCLRVMATIVAISRNPDPHVGELRSALNDPELRIRRLSSYLLFRLGPLSKQAIEPLVGALSDPAMRWYSAEALGAIGMEGGLCVPPLLRLGQDALAQEHERVAAIRALASFGTYYEQIDAVLCPLTRTDSIAVRRAAVETIGDLGKATDRAVQALTTAVDDRIGEVALAAICSLGKLGPRAAKAVPVLKRRRARIGVKYWEEQLTEALEKIEAGRREN